MRTISEKNYGDGFYGTIKLFYSLDFHWKRKIFR